jgi:aminopeptidase N
MSSFLFRPAFCLPRGFFPTISSLLVLLLCLATAAPAALRPPRDLPEYRLQVSVDPVAGTIQGQARITAPAGGQLRLDPGALNIHQISSRGRYLKPNPRAAGLLVLPSPVEITYTLDVGKTEDNFVNAAEVVLLGLWYPVLEGFCRFQVTVRVPAGYLAVSEAETVSRRDLGEQQEFIFHFPHPLHETDGVNLAVSNRWRTSEDSYNDVTLVTYLSPELAHLAPLYLARAKSTLAKYEKLLAPFPYRRLALVSNSHEVTQAFPTFILMDRLDFQDDDLDRTPLDHEILHQWFGCGVSGDLSQGNWFEGLTIYLADHLLMEEKGVGWQCRRRILSGFQAYMQRQQEFPLRDFTERLDKHSRVIGYGKGAMVFHMLRRQIGDVAFFAGLRRFVRDNLHASCASWADLARAFQQTSGQNLTWFFRQWVEGTGQPELRVAASRVKQVGHTYEVQLRLSQAGTRKRLLVPLTFHGVDRSRTITVPLSDRTRTVTYKLAFLPEEVSVDEQYDVFRQLTAKENPPTVERLTASHLAIVPAAGLEDRARRLLEVWRHKEVSCQVLSPSETASPTRPPRSFLILGAAHPWVPQLFGALDLPAKGCTILVRPHPQQPGALAGLLHCHPGEAPDAISRKLLAYPFASEVHLEGGQIAWRRLAPTEQGIRQALPLPITPTQ